MTIRVLLAEDHHIVRQGTRLFLESMGLEVVGEASNGQEAVIMARELHPDVILIDIRMPELTGIEATRRIRHEDKDIGILILSAYDDATYVRALLEAGADGFVLKTAQLPDVYEALCEVAAGRSAFAQQVMEKVMQTDYDPARIVDELTDREIEVLTHAAHGLTNKEIGAVLFISNRTVQGHLQKIYGKLGVTTRTEAVTTALKHGLIALNKENQ